MANDTYSTDPFLETMQQAWRSGGPGWEKARRTVQNREDEQASALAAQRAMQYKPPSLVSGGGLVSTSALSEPEIMANIQAQMTGRVQTPVSLYWGGRAYPKSDVRETPGYYKYWDTYSQDFKLAKLPTGKLYAGSTWNPTGSSHGPAGFYQTGDLSQNFVDDPNYRPFVPPQAQRPQPTFRVPQAPSSRGSVMPSDIFAPIRPLQMQAPEPGLSQNLAALLGRARQRAIVTMAQRSPYSLWGK